MSLRGALGSALWLACTPTPAPIEPEPIETDSPAARPVRHRHPECTLSPPPGTPLSEAAEPGAVLCLSEGRYPAGLVIAYDLKIRGFHGAVLEGSAGSPVLEVRDGQVSVSDVRLEDGGGGGLRVGGGHASLSVVTIASAPGPALAIDVTGGRLDTLSVNLDPDHRVRVGGSGELWAIHTLATGPLEVRGSGRVNWAAGLLDGGVDIQGDATDRPYVRLHKVDPTHIRNEAPFPGQLIEVGKPVRRGQDDRGER